MILKEGIKLCGNDAIGNVNIKKYMERSGNMSLFLKYYVRDKETGVYHSDKFDTIKAALMWIYNHTPRESGMFDFYEIVREDQI